MAQFLEIWDYMVIVLVLVVSTCIGLYFRFTGGRQKTLEEFLLAERNMAIFPAAVSILATFLSAISMLGIPAEVYLYGLQMYATLLGLPLGYLLCAFGCLPVYFDLNVSTSYEVSEFHNKK
ncbi:Putative sodium-dependent multivitamin transporter [Araneus ventricosus]|uniref:Sodium-dependent multivitamin transporter n=1 Tax=Araneus ventricosus TaxID=182803 RepID=A0A4Y2DA31_ARAVE|nr:Putative sodium-dependent multivitamin transporter [Araneus ventricosus]